MSWIWLKLFGQVGKKHGQVKYGTYSFNKAVDFTAAIVVNVTSSYRKSWTCGYYVKEWERLKDVVGNVITDTKRDHRLPHTNTSIFREGAFSYYSPVLYHGYAI